MPVPLHDCTKAETTAVESGNRLLRHDLACFRRRTKCDSQDKQMLLQAVWLLHAKKNSTLSRLL